MRTPTSRQSAPIRGRGRYPLGDRCGRQPVGHQCAIAREAKHLTVFQHTPNFCVPARNGAADSAVTKAHADCDGERQCIKNSFFGFELNSFQSRCSRPCQKSANREFDRMWEAGRFALRLLNYLDTFFSKETNDVIADYLKRKDSPYCQRPGGRREADPRFDPFCGRVWCG